MPKITQAVASSAITDLLAGLVLVPMLISLFKTKTSDKILKRRWMTFLVFLTMSSLMGFAAHYFFVREIPMKIIWIFLYGLLFETVNTFLLLALYYVGDKYIRCVRLTMYTVMTVLWIYVEYAEFVMKINPIKTFIVYAFVFTLAAFVIFAFCAAKSSGKSAKILMCAFVPLIIAGVFQLGQEIAVHFIWDFNEDGIAHILIILSLFIIYASAKSGLKTGKE